MRIRPLYAGVGLAAAAGLLAVACGGAVAATPSHRQAMPAANAPAPPLVSTASRSVGGAQETVLTDGQGRTLYYFAPEKDAKVVTTPDLLQTWPVLKAGSTTTPSSSQPLPGKLGIVTRPDGTRQVTYNEFPLYTFAGDKTPGDTAGQGVNGRWFAMQSVLPPDADGDGDGTQPAAQAPAMQQPAAPTQQPAASGPARQPAAQPQAPPPAPAAAPAPRPMAPAFNDGDADNRGGDNDGDGNG